MPDATPASPDHPTTGVDPEAGLPGWQQWLNTTCENWIFAFIVAMAIRHFCLEAFRIPTASMEPMLYGEPAFSKADHVVVDKLLFRFTGPKRWDVTVFQFPLPEVEPRKGEHTDARIAIDAAGHRLDTPMIRPLMYRNFVKRAVILPGDRFYLSGGNVYLEQPDHRWQAARKPADLQAVLWQEVYRLGAQDGYLPWTGAGGASASSSPDGLALTLAEGGRVQLFPQQLRNLYLKPGLFRVRPYGSGDAEDELIELSMTRPQFVHRKSGRTGVAWDLDRWAVSRVTTADLDSNSYGTLLNRTMSEYVGDVRVSAGFAKLAGEVVLELNQGKLHSYRLVLGAAGWSVTGDGKELGKGADQPTAGELSFTHLDDQLILAIGGSERLRVDVPAVDPLHRLEVAWSGTGSALLSRLAIDRDVHYTVGGDGSFLRDELATATQLRQEVEALGGLASARFEADEKAKMLRLIEGVRAQMLGKPLAELTPRQLSAPTGYSPETAVTAPPGAYLMLGDNSPQSWDSRCWGWVAAENLRGRVLAVVLPFSRWRVVR
jgi:signal peptidase I